MGELVGESVRLGIGGLVGDLVGASISSSINAAGTPGISTWNVIVSPLTLIS